MEKKKIYSQQSTPFEYPLVFEKIHYSFIMWEVVSLNAGN